MLRRFLLLALVPVASTQLAHAQGTTRDDSIARVSLPYRINGHALIRVRGSWGTAFLNQPQLVGQVLTYASAASEPGALPRPLTLDAVDRIQARGSAAGTGALVGAAIGAAAGVPAGVALAKSLNDIGFGSSSSPDYGGTMLLTVPVSAAGGALLGALIGATFKKWKTVYHARN